MTATDERTLTADEAVQLFPADSLRTNPWGLTLGESKALDAYSQTGSPKSAAKLLDCNEKTLQAHIHRAMERMKMNRVAAAIAWDRWAFDGRGYHDAV